MKTLLRQLRRWLAPLLSEGLEPLPAAMAVFWGLLIGIVPIYGLQTLAALGVAVLFRLNKPLTFAATFINNPFLQPFLVISSVELGSCMRAGKFLPLHLAHWSGAELRHDVLLWVEGSLLLGVIVGLAGAVLTAGLVAAMRAAKSGLRCRLRFVNGYYAAAPGFDRGFVRWKMRMDRIFGLLNKEDLGTGTAVDLGCGYGMALCFASFGDQHRRIEGCDLDARRIEVARSSLASFDARLEVEDVRLFQIPQAGLILILDVLQYLSDDEQMALIERCACALEPGGKFIFRVHDRERGLRSRLTMAFDRLIFKVGNAPNRPLILPEQRYRQALEAAGLQVRSRRFRNLLPLAHILFVAERPLAERAQ